MFLSGNRTGGMRIELSKHAILKSEERGLAISEIEETVKTPDFVYYDLVAKTIVAIKSVKIGGMETNLIVPYVKPGDDEIKVVTAYPCRDLAGESGKKEGVRWIRIK